MTIEQIVEILVDIHKPFIASYSTEQSKVYTEQLTTEECIVSYVFFSKAEYEEACMNHESQLSERLVFPAYYLKLKSVKEVEEDIRQRQKEHNDFLLEQREKSLKENKGKLDIDISLSITREEYAKLIDLIQSSDLSSKVKKSFSKDNWKNEYDRMVETKYNNHLYFKYK